jgi:hypothetical protein
MLFWWPNSPYYWAGIYIGGINATCPPGTTANPNLNNAWIAEVTGTTGKNEHWDLAPIYVGLQAPCPNPHPPFSNFFSFDPQTAWNQGVAAAQDAISQYGGPILQLGTPPTYPTLIYFDLEGFNYTGFGTSCATAVINFLGGWTAYLHSVQAISGVYGSSGSTMAIMQDYLNTSFQQNRPDDIWPAGSGSPNWVTTAPAYTSTATVFYNSYVVNTNWQSNQRLYQYSPGLSECYPTANCPNGTPRVTLQINTDCGDGQLIGYWASRLVGTGCGRPYN